MLKNISLAAVIMLSLAACKDDDETAACTKDELGAKVAEFATKIQENPAKAQSILSDVQEISEKFQGQTSGGEPSAETINELCKAYDGLLEKL